MGVRQTIVCDGCGHTSPIPVPRNEAGMWQVLDKDYNLQHLSLYWCGRCPNRQSIVERLETWRPEIRFDPARGR